MEILALIVLLYMSVIAYRVLMQMAKEERKLEEKRLEMEARARERGRH